MVIIRPLAPNDDLGDLVALSRAFFSDYEAHHPLFCIGELRDADIIAFFRRSLEDEDGCTWVAEADGHIVGYLTASVREQARFYRIDRVGAISGLMVAEGYRRKGIAGRLHAAALALFRERGVAYYTVYTATANTGALAFYARQGMTPLLTTLVGTVPEGTDGAART
jgi:ribosomal protein S18 acetylase RimI-like enzyme